MIFDRVLAAARDQNDVRDAGGHGLFDAILNDRLVDERQHFLRLRFGRGKEACSKARRRKHGFSNGCAHERHRSRGISKSHIESMVEVSCLIQSLSVTMWTKYAQVCAIAALMWTKRSRISRRLKSCAAA